MLRKLISSATDKVSFQSVPSTIWTKKILDNWDNADHLITIATQTIPFSVSLFYPAYEKMAKEGWEKINGNVTEWSRTVGISENYNKTELAKFGLLAFYSYNYIQEAADQNLISHQTAEDLLTLAGNLISYLSHYNDKVDAKQSRYWAQPDHLAPLNHYLLAVLKNDTLPHYKPCDSFEENIIKATFFLRDGLLKLVRTPEELNDFISAMGEYLESTIILEHNRANNLYQLNNQPPSSLQNNPKIPQERDILGYIDDRQYNGGVQVLLELAFLFLKKIFEKEIPQEIKKSILFQNMKRQISDVICIMDDIFSAKKAQRESINENMVIIFRNILDKPDITEESINLSAKLCNGQMKKFLQDARYLNKMFPQQKETNDRIVSAMLFLTLGNIVWLQEAERDD